MAIFGKGLWVWKAAQVTALYGSAALAVQAAVDAGVRQLYVKAANGWYAWLPGTPEAKDLPELLDAAAANGLELILWRYSYAHTVTGEVDAAGAAWDAYGSVASAWIEDAEEEYKKAGGGQYATDLAKGVRAEISPAPLGFSSYRFPTLHAPFPFAAWIGAADFAAPQVYWEGAINSAEQLERSFIEHRAIDASVVVLPVGAAYQVGAWKPAPSELGAFSARAKSLGMSAISFWRWDTAVKLGLYDAIAGMDWAPPGGSTKHWSALTPQERDAALLRTAQAVGVADMDGFVLV